MIRLGLEARFHSIIVKNALEMGVQLVSVFRAIQLKGAEEEEEEEWRPNGICTAVVDNQREQSTMLRGTG